MNGKNSTSEILWKTRFIGEFLSLNVDKSVSVKTTHTVSANGIIKALKLRLVVKTT